MQLCLTQIKALAPFYDLKKKMSTVRGFDNNSHTYIFAYITYLHPIILLLKGFFNKSARRPKSLSCLMSISSNLGITRLD